MIRTEHSTLHYSARFDCFTILKYDFTKNVYLLIQDQRAQHCTRGMLKKLEATEKIFSKNTFTERALNNCTSGTRTSTLTFFISSTYLTIIHQILHFSADDFEKLLLFCIRVHIVHRCVSVPCALTECAF